MDGWVGGWMDGRMGGWISYLVFLVFLLKVHYLIQVEVGQMVLVHRKTLYVGIL